MRGKGIALATLLCAVVAIAPSANARVGPGSLDAGFGRDGVSTVDLPGKDMAWRSAIQRDGKVVLAGVSGGHLAVVRLLQGGGVDHGFAQDGVRIVRLGATAGPTGVGIASDGSIVVGAYVESPRTYTGDRSADGVAQVAVDGLRVALVKLRPDGRFDQSFGQRGIVRTQTDAVYPADDVPIDVAVLPDGRVVVLTITGASFGYFGYPSAIALMGFTARGERDTSFGVGGVAPASYAGALPGAAELAVQRDGKLVVVANEHEVSFATFFPVFFIGQFAPWAAERYALPGDIAVFRYLSNGVPDPTFGVAGVASVDLSPGTDNVQGVALQPDGNILVHGQGLAESGFVSVMARLTSTGALDPTFGNGGRAVYRVREYSSMRDVVVQRDGRIVAAMVAYSRRTRHNSGDLIARFESDGSLDPTFGSDGMVEVPLGQALLMGVRLQGRRIIGYGAGAEGPQKFAAVAVTS